jgi:hypothetical protein
MIQDIFLMASSPTSGAVHRTGPMPIAMDYSQTLIQALVNDGEDRLPVGPVSRVQLLVTCLFERLHDAIYVLPRAARDPDAPPVDPAEYARDIALLLKALKKFSAELPDDSTKIEGQLEELNAQLRSIRTENAQMLQEAKRVQEKIYDIIVKL